ncbi:MAG: NAD+ synthase, partial [Candidatus Atribacteria bacterium]|nr:NAD+ synthase [Candidatus Atribacteria bacterium]
MNPKVGDIEGNVHKIKHFYHKLLPQNPDLIVFPELCLVGYPPKDLLERWWFIEQIQKAKEELIVLTSNFSNSGMLFGLPLPTNEDQGRGLVNSALLVYQGKVIHQQNKTLLPTYDVFDETRYFDPARQLKLVSFKDEFLGISICEDAWNDPEFWPKGRRYQLDPIQVLAEKGATCLFNISASPFQIDKEVVRYRLIHNHSKRFRLPFVYVNQVGGNDDLIFDGKSLVCNNQGNLIEKAPGFQEWAGIVDFANKSPLKEDRFQDSIESVFDALVLGVHDYMRKCGFKKAVVGLSGGIDSALTAVIATRAIGPSNVLGISMPSPYSSAGSVEDSQRLSQNLGISFEVIPISSIYFSYLSTLSKSFSGTKKDTTEENLQARIRGNILMAFSNKYGYLLLSTGNKSEMATGYCTLYGDMSGGLAVLSDVPKTMV